MTSILEEASEFLVLSRQILLLLWTPTALKRQWVIIFVAMRMWSNCVTATAPGGGTQIWIEDSLVNDSEKLDWNQIEQQAELLPQF